MHELNSIPEVNICLLLFSALVSFALFIGAAADNTRNRSFMKHFMSLLVINIISQLGEAGILIWQGIPEKAWLVRLCCVVALGVSSLLIVLFTRCMLELLREREKITLLPVHIMSVLCAILFIFVIASLFNGMIFSVDQYGNFTDGPCDFFIDVYDVITLLYADCLLIRYRRLFPLRGFTALLCYCILPWTSILLTNVWYPTPLYLMTTFSLIFVFIFYHGETIRQLSEKERELTESRIAIMVSQIQPHFLYNSLNTIYHLCSKDVSLAKQAISSFSEYLKHILNSVSRTTPVSFEEELQHTKAYLELEKMRFDEELNIMYHIETTSFVLPALTLQPLVENAVKHGICPKEGGGTVAVSVKEYPEYFEIMIEDDGMGFDLENILSDEKTHIGLQNIKYRLGTMCDGTLMIESKLGEGTTAIIRLPKEKENDDTCDR